MMKQYIMNDIEKTLEQCDSLYVDLMLQKRNDGHKAAVLRAKAETLKAWAILCAAENLKNETKS